MIYLFAWLVVAIITALVASSKNRSPLAWALLAIPLGLIATIIVACSSKLPSPEFVEAQHAATRDSKVCPQCAETVKAAAQICRFCGHRFDATSIPAPIEHPWALVEDWGDGYGLFEYRGERLRYDKSGVRWQSTTFDSPELAIASLNSYLG